MKRRTFWRVVTMDRSDLLDRLLALLRERGIRYCVIGGQAVNAYTEPVVSLDLDLVLAAEDVAAATMMFEEQFQVERFPHSINIAARDSDLRVQIQTDPRYGAFLDRASEREVLGIRLPVAAAADVLQGKIWAAEDPGRRGSKRQKDLADIARLIEVEPSLKALVPRAVLDRLV